MSALATLFALHPKLHLSSEQVERPKRLALNSPVAPDPQHVGFGTASDEDAFAGIDDVLPDGGLPRGAVVELSSARMLGGLTALSLRACAAAQAEARLLSGDPRTEGAFCAFLDPYRTLHAPAVVAAGVDPTRLLVVRPPEDALARVAVRMAESRVFSILVVDTAAIPGVTTHESLAHGGRSSRGRLDRWQTVVRRLSLAVAPTDTTVLLLSDLLQPRSMPLPVAMRLELERRFEPAGLWLRVAKERHGRVGNAAPIRASRQPSYACVANDAVAPRDVDAVGS